MSDKGLSGSETEGDVTVRLVLVAAVANDRIIGRDSDMPWYLPEGLKQFKRTTIGHSVVMGRRTYESITRQPDGPLPERHSVVLTTCDLDLPEGAETARSIGSAVVAAEGVANGMSVEAVYIAGGTTVYEQFFSRATGLVLIELDAAHEGDMRFLKWDRGRWVETDHDDRDGFSFVTYERRQPAAADRGVEESDE